MRRGVAEGVRSRSAYSCSRAAPTGRSPHKGGKNAQISYCHHRCAHRVRRLGEGGHEAHLKLFGYAVEPMAKSTFYFSIAVLVAVDIIQSGYQKKLDMQRRLEQDGIAGTGSA